MSQTFTVLSYDPEVKMLGTFPNLTLLTHFACDLKVVAGRDVSLLSHSLI
jgi:hypothetical protein